MSDKNSLAVQIHDYSIGIDLNTTIWRYVSLDAFLTTLHSSKLRFTRIGAFDDEFEGIEDSASLNALEEDARLFSRQFNEPYFPPPSQFTNALNKYGGYASCWTTNPPTDMVMWRSYAPALSSVAMRSSVGNLMNGLIDVPGQSFIGRIKYKNAGGINRANLHYQDKCFEKFDAYSYEAEVRLFISLVNEPRRPEQLSQYPDHHSEFMDGKYLEAVALHPLVSGDTRVAIKEAIAALEPSLRIEEPTIAER
jgi:hypothetical protein